MADRALVVVTRVAQGRQTLAPEARRVQDTLPAVPSEEWVASREQLLGRVVAAAIRRVRVPLRWVWRTVPERHDQVADIARRVYPEAVLVDQESASDAVWPDATRFLTVRLDSDDAFLPAALDLAAGLEVEAGTIVDWWQGWQLDWPSGRLAARCWPRHLQGPFLALAHDTRAGMLDVGGPHDQVRTGHRWVTVEERSWIQVVHPDNLMNRWRAHGPPLGVQETRRVLEQAGITAAGPAA